MLDRPAPGVAAIVAILSIVALAALGALGALGGLGARPAVASPALRVLILDGPGRDEVMERVEGQVADLAVTLTRGPALGIAPDVAAQLARARGLAATHDVSAVVWFVRDDDGWIIHVADPIGGRLLVRRVDAGGAMSESAALEAAALVVRTAIRGLAAGGEIGVAAEPIATAPTTTTTSVAAPAASRTAASFRPIAGIGWATVFDGLATSGHHGLAARLGVAGGRWQGGVALGYAAPTAHRTTLATIEIDRQTAGGYLDRRWTATPRTAIAASIAIAAVRFGRATTATATALAPTDDRATWAIAITPTVRLVHRLAAGAHLELAVGAELLPRVPEFGVEGASGFVAVGRPWPIEPTLGLQIVVGSP